MRSMWMLAAAAALAACAGRGEDDMGAAPDRGDTTVTTGIDTTQWDTTNTSGAVQTPEPAVVPDTATTPAPEYPTTPEPTVDTTTNEPGYPSDDSSMDPGAAGGYDTTAVPSQDPTGAGVPPADPTLPADTDAGVPPADPGMTGDTTMTPDAGAGYEGTGTVPADTAVSQ